jgi:acetyltransferase-like isoleucine patch superfamily enzyme
MGIFKTPTLLALHYIWQEFRHIVRINRLSAKFGCTISPKTRLTGPDDNIIIGPGTVVNAYCNFRFRSGRITIGANSLFAQFVTVLANTHEYDDREKSVIEQAVKVADVVIGDNVWIGVDVVIMPGVHIGDGAIIGANSVVTRDVGRNEVWAGSPATKIKMRGG